MGKQQKKKKLQSVRVSPVAPKGPQNAEELLQHDASQLAAIDDQLGFSDDDLEATKTQVIEKINSIKATDREHGALLFIHLLQKLNKLDADDIAKHLDHEADFIREVLRTMGPFLVDEQASVRYATSDAFAQLSSLCEPVCELMVEFDLMTPIIAAIEKYFGPKSKFEDKKTAINYLHICSLLTNLCSNSKKGIRIFNQYDNLLAASLMTALSSENNEVAIASAECLQVVTEENVVPALMNNEAFSIVHNIASSRDSPEHCHLALIATSILINMSQMKEEEVIENIDFALSSEYLSLINDFASLLNEEQLNGKEEKEEMVVEDQSGSDKVKERIQKMTTIFNKLDHILVAKHLAAEILANLCSPGEDEKDEDFETDDEMDCESDEADNPIETICESGDVLPEESRLSMSKEVENMIIERSIFAKLLNHLVALEPELKEKLQGDSMGDHIRVNLLELQRRCLICVNNMMTVLPCDRLKPTLETWQHLRKFMSFMTNGSESNRILSEVLSVLRVFASLPLPLSFYGFSEQEVNDLMAIVQSAEHPLDARISSVRILGSLTSKTDCDLNALERVTQLFMDMLNALQSTPQDVVLKAEILDTIMDMYSSDGQPDAIIVKLALIPKLKNILKEFKKEAQSLRKAKQLRDESVVFEVRDNLQRFIQYKTKTLSL